MSSTATADLVIETRGLRKEFSGRRGHRVAVQDLDLAVPRGGVHGFLGPNGSGKTTTIRMLLGLARATRGEMALFGTPVPAGLPQVIDRVGAVVEMPKFLPHFTGRQNLTILARSKGIAAERVDAAVDTVGLTGRDGDRYRAYSLGMKQRLAIAATLLKDPQLLILDEPTNGLDPAGIREIRETIRTLGESGVTVLLSSHILAEVQQVCTSATIIGNGRLLASGRVEDLLGASTSYRIVVDDPDAARRALAERSVRRPRRRHVAARGDRAPAAEITRTLGEAGIWLSELTSVRPDLETVFLELTSQDTLGSTDGGWVAHEAPRRRAHPRCAGGARAWCSWSRPSLVPALIWAGTVWGTRPYSERRGPAGHRAGPGPARLRPGAAPLRAQARAVPPARRGRRDDEADVSEQCRTLVTRGGPATTASPSTCGASSTAAAPASRSSWRG